MNRLLHAEWRKSWATPTLWWLLVGATLLAVVSAVAALVIAGNKGDALDSPPVLNSAMHPPAPDRSW